MTPDCAFDATLSTLSDKPITFLKLLCFLSCITSEPDRELAMALNFLELCLELDPQKRISASEALQHPFLGHAEDDQYLDDEVFLT